MGIRGRIWVFALVLLTIAAALFSQLLAEPANSPDLVRSSSGPAQRPELARRVPFGSALSVPSAGAEETSREATAPPRSGMARAPEVPSSAGPSRVPAGILPTREVAPGRSSELASLEYEASRWATDLGLAGPLVDYAFKTPRPAPGETEEEAIRRASDERQRFLATEFLVEATYRRAAQSQLFPSEMPDVQLRLREAARSEVNAYEANTDAKLARLRDYLDDPTLLQTPVKIQYAPPARAAAQPIPGR